MRMLLEVVQQARQRLGFHTNLEISGPAESKSNGRVEREIQTVRGRARTIVHGLKEGCQIQVKPSSPVFLWAMRHAGWPLTHYRRQGGGPTAYEARTGRKYCGKVAIFGGRVLAIEKRVNGSDKFEAGIWLGKTNRSDFHMVATASGLKWTRTIRRLPTPFDAEAVTYVKYWPWNVGFGQIGAKTSPLVSKLPTAPLPPALAPAIRAEEKRQAREERMKQKVPGIEDKAAEGEEREGGQSEAGVSERRGNEKRKADDEDSLGEYTPSSPHEEESVAINDDTMLQDLLDSLKRLNQVQSEQAAAKKLRGKHQRRCLRPCPQNNLDENLEEEKETGLDRQ